VYTPVDATLTARYINVYRNPGTFIYSDCYVNGFTFSASEGGPLQLSIDVIGGQETADGSGTFPSLTCPVDPPFMFADSSGAFNIAASAYGFSSFSLSVSHALTANANNSLYANQFFANDRSIAWQLSMPWSSTVSGLYVAPATLTTDATFTNGGYSLNIDSNYVKYDKAGPILNGRGDTVFARNGMARASGSNAALIITLDTTA
jgi:hypothetical protein